LKLGLYFDLRDPPPWRQGWGAVYARALETAERADADGRRIARAAGPLTLVLADDPERAWAAIRPHAEYGWRTYDEYAREGREDS
jgi:hypothetical protein